MRAVINQNKPIYFFDYAGAIAGGTLTAEITDPSGAAFGSALTFTQQVESPALFLTSAIKFTTTGQYTVLIKYDGSVITRRTVDVGSSPVTDYPLGAATTVFIDDHFVGGQNETVTFKLLSSTGVLSSSGAAAFSVPNSGYAFSATFSTEGTYYAVWYKEIGGVATPFEVEEILIGTSSSVNEPVTITVANTSEVLQNNVRVVVHSVTSANSIKDTTGNTVYTTGSRVADAYTDSSGDVNLELPPGTYVVTLAKTGYVFSPNNGTLTVSDSNTKAPDPAMPWVPKKLQKQHIISNAFQANLGNPTSPVNTCTLYATLYKMTGEPLRNATVSVALVDKPQLLSGNAVFDTKITAKTDENGYVSFDLAQGVTVEVAIAPLSLRRTITVPSGDDAASPVNILTLMSGADDPFDIVTPNIPAAPRRTL